MRIELSGEHLDITSAIRQYVEEKFGSLEHLLSRFEAEGETVAYVDVARSTAHHRHGNVFRVVATLHLPGKTFRVEHSDVDARIAVDVAKDTLKRDIIRHKDMLGSKNITRK